jgi:hypothetical protein
MDHNMFELGTKFEVVEPTDDSTYGVGSTGFIFGSSKIDSSFMNVGVLSAIFIRRGKGGKERINNKKFYTPIFTIDNPGFCKIMPDKGVRKPFLYIKRVDPLPFDVMEASNIEFLGWSVAYVRHIQKMYESCKHSRWPENKSHIFNRLIKAPDYFEENPEKWFEDFTAENARAEIIETIRMAVSSMVKVNLSFDKDRLNSVATAAEFLDFVNNGEFIPKDAENKENEYRFTEDEKSLKENIKFYKKLVEDIEKFIKLKQTKS